MCYQHDNTHTSLLDTQSFTNLPVKKRPVLLKVTAVNPGDQRAVIINTKQGGAMFIGYYEQAWLVVHTMVAGSMTAG